MRRKIHPILSRIPASRQSDARHYGVHPYFTRRPSNVVRDYIRHYTEVGDCVLDPFGGTGVTAVEAYLLKRHAIQNDINPFANFLASCLVDPNPDSLLPLREAFGRVEDSCRDTVYRIEKSEKYAESILRQIPLPENILLPRNSDAERFYDLFSTKQLAALGEIKRVIDSEADTSVRNLLLLAWSASIAKLNLTFLSAKGRAASRGGSSIFSIYRYKLAKNAVELPIWNTFEGRYKNVIKAKQEILSITRKDDFDAFEQHNSFRVMQHDAASLSQYCPSESVDYIFTDPPYGGFINYLDLSVMWNHWLGFDVSSEERESETIVGGEMQLTDDHYKESLRKSIVACLDLLKPDRWFSIVFQHWDVSYFETILETATQNGGELKAAITQTGDVIWSMHKKKNSQSVLGGEMILTFYKSGRTQGKSEQEMRGSSSQMEDVRPVEETLETVVDELSMESDQFTHESLFNRLVLKLWDQRSLGCLNLDRNIFSTALKNCGLEYDEKSHLWLKKDAKGSRDKHKTLF